MRLIFHFWSCFWRVRILCIFYHIMKWVYEMHIFVLQIYILSKWKIIAVMYSTQAAAMTFHFLKYISAVQIYEFYIFISCMSSSSTGILRTHKWPAPSWPDSSVGKSAALVSLRSWVPFPFMQAWIFFRLAFLSCVSWVHYCDDLSFA